ncbi:MAG: SDR family oxidoreductase [Myxococcaceae bacterium]|nr:SDR family oxidoreductase [Myxococcaceae bacterium]
MKGKNVVITGAFGALGTAVRAAFEQVGATLHTPPAELLDLTDEAGVVKYYASLPPLWASVHLAGGYATSPFTETSLAEMKRQWDMNFVTAFLCSREAVKRGASRIVNTVSRVVAEPVGGAVAYSTSKAALVTLTQSLAVELRPKGVLVNAVAPSIMDTPANRKAMPDADPAKWPKTAEVAKAIVFLASEENALTSGAVLPVYGQIG